ncbi:MAG: ABC transporter ATP-binding protein [Candidatus Aenigmarchaeota archaeon]|nr:ABC transporter ATP-binding protein [Candidatus Aenigmarchaeota archaeon]
MKALIELKNAKKIYTMGQTEVIALDKTNLKINKNEFISIIGPSGSGKSTLLDVMCCLSRPTEGKVFIDGKDTSEMNDNELAYIRGRKIGFVFQTFNLIQRLTALENVMLPMWFIGKPESERRKRAEQVLKSVGLEKRLTHRPSEMSGGERQRVAIARALANNPDIIVGDEPTGNLDSKAGKEILSIFENLHKEGKTVILVTHDLSIAKPTKKRIYIKDGKIEKVEVKK